jgi:hypothetical protein
MRRMQLQWEGEVAMLLHKSNQETNSLTPMYKTDWRPGKATGAYRYLPLRSGHRAGGLNRIKQWGL